MPDTKKKLLIIEDDEHVSRVYDVKFTHEGYQTVFAKNGNEALEKIALEKPDLIILDLMIPGKDGFAVLEEVKQNQELAAIPIIILSNLGQPSDQERALALGAREYLVKVDYSMQEVINKVKSYL